MEAGTANFNNFKEAQKSPLATSLFQIEGVSGAFFSEEFVTVSVNEEADWSLVRVFDLSYLKSVIIRLLPLRRQNLKSLQR